jgi:hypothetical protein
MSLQLSPGTGRSHERRERRGHPATQPDTARFARARLITIGPDPQTVQARVTRGWAEPRRTIWTNLATLRGWPSSSILSLQVTLLLVGGVYVPGNRRGEIVHPFDPKGWTIGWTKSSLSGPIAVGHGPFFAAIPSAFRHPAAWPAAPVSARKSANNSTGLPQIGGVEWIVSRPAAFIVRVGSHSVLAFGTSPVAVCVLWQRNAVRPERNEQSIPTCPPAMQVVPACIANARKPPDRA